MKIIGFGHRKRTGKDTCAGFLETILRAENPGIKTIKVSFASKLKAICYSLFMQYGLKPSIHYETHPEDREIILPRIGKTPRQIWIEVGNFMRSLHPDIWIDCAIEGRPDADWVIITDVRFDNEINAIRALGGKVHKVIRGSAPVSDDPTDSALKDYDKWDGIIDNNGTLKDLYAKMETLARDSSEGFTNG